MSRVRRASVIACALLGLVHAPAWSEPAARPGETHRITVGWNQGEGAGPHGFFGRSGTGHVAITPDGRFIAFDSRMNNLVPVDTNNQPDVFVHDRHTGETTLVSVASDGTQANGHSSAPDISHDGRYVVFDSDATNLVPGDGNARVDVFLHDLLTGATSRVSLKADGTESGEDSDAPTISGDGGSIVYTGDASSNAGDLCEEIYLHDRTSGSVELLSVTPDGARSNGACLYGSFPDVSYDGRYVAWESFAHDLVERDTNGSWDIFVRDRERDVTERVSVATDGSEANYVSYMPSISDDGRFVAFESAASNLVPADGNWDTSNGGFDVFVRDRLLNRTERVSVADDGEESLTPGAVFASISPDGRYVAFVSWASDLAPGADNGWEQILVHDRLGGTTEIASVSSAGEQGNGTSSFAKAPAISNEGRFIAFSSQASNLVPGDEQTAPEPEDVFVRDRGPQLGVGSIRAQDRGTEIAVDGWTTFSGILLGRTDDPESDASPNAPVGADIVAASLIQRPERAEIVLDMDLAELPSVRAPGASGYVTPSLAATPLRYRWLFATEAGQFQVSGSIANEPGHQRGDFRLYRLTAGGREELATVHGSVGSAGEDVRVVIPLAVVDAEPGDALISVRAASVLGTDSDAVRILDEALIGDRSIAPVTVGVAVGRVGSRPPDEAFSGEALGTFSRSLLPGGDGDVVWWRTCLGAHCETGTTPIR